jgi:hypothetical protein
MVESRWYMSFKTINDEHHTVEEKHETHYEIKSRRGRDAVDLDRLRHSEENIDVISSIMTSHKYSILAFDVSPSGTS